MLSNDEVRLIRNPDLIATDMGGELVMMSVERGEYFGIGGIGPQLWHQLESPQSVQQLCASVCAEFDVDPARCLSDVQTFVGALLDKGLLQAC